MFSVEYQLATGVKVKHDFATKAERDAFASGVESAISWPRRTHQGVTLSESQPAPAPAPVKVVPAPVKPVVPPTQEAEK